MNTEVYLTIKKKIKETDAIVIGAGAGLSTAAGIQYGTANFKENFPELVQHYGFTDMYTSSFYEFLTEEERWSYWSKHINYLYLSKKATKLYQQLFDLVKEKDYFVVTTNVDRQFIKAGFEETRVFEVQGTLSKLQCAKACHHTLYDNKKLITKLQKYKNDVKIPSKLVPKCPLCGGAMEVNLRKDNFFVEDNYWHEHQDSYHQFLEDKKDKKVLFLELGVGFNTPGIIRYPFEDYTNQFKNAYFIRINQKFANLPTHIKEKGMGFEADIKEVFNHLL